MDRNAHKLSAAALEAMRTAEQAKTAGFGALFDRELRNQLRDCAPNAVEQHDPEQVARAIGLINVTVRRRMGMWRAVLSDPQDLAGPVKALREAAERIIASALSNSVHAPDLSMETWARTVTDRSGVDGNLKPALFQLLIALIRTRIEHPSDILLPAEFYDAVMSVDDTGCLEFSPTVQQLAAAALLLEETVVEMDSGDGKTLASMIAAAVFAASGRSVHVLTANDYLASRDCDEMARVLEPLGLSVGLVIDNMDRDERRHQHARQIVYTTAREVGFDYLRDSVSPSLDWRVRPVFDVAIVDEADHQLVDQARTPLIISDAPTQESEADVGEQSEYLAEEVIERQARHVDDLYAKVARQDWPDRLLAEIMLAGGLTPRLISTLEQLNLSTRAVRRDTIGMNDDDDGSPLESDLLFAVDVDGPSLRLTETGWRFIWERADTPTVAFEVVQMLRARVVHDSDEDYVVDEDGVTIVDPLDGRPMHSHRYMDGLHDALESKEGIKGRGHTRAKARTTIHALLSNYDTVAGLTGTAMEASEVFAKSYGVNTVRVPSNFPSRRSDLGAAVSFDRAAHVRAVLGEVAHWHRLGRPLLLTVGTVRQSSEISEELSRRSIDHRVLNAGNPTREAEIVTAAGEPGAVTVSTAMAGRGTDIIVEPEVDERIVEACVEMARHSVSRRVAVVFRCPSDEEADILAGAFEDVVDVKSSRLEFGTDVEVRGENVSGDVRTEIVPFGLGLMVVMASMSPSPRVERQIVGRTGRQGRFGGSRMLISLNDPVLAFSRHQFGLLNIREAEQPYVEGDAVRELLRQAQRDAESHRQRVSGMASQFEAVIETESRAHYALRESMMTAEGAAKLLDTSRQDWIDRVTASLYGIRGDYKERFARVATDLNRRCGIDIGWASGLTPADVVELLNEEIDSQLFRHRSRLGPKGLSRLVCDLFLGAVDEMWPAHLETLHEMAVSIALGAVSVESAVTQFAEEVLRERTKLRRAAADTTWAEILRSPGLESVPDSEIDAVERLPRKLSSLLT